jgi:hypothetical protein
MIVPSLTRTTVTASVPRRAAMIGKNRAPTIQKTSGRSAWRHGSRRTAARSASLGVRPSIAQAIVRMNAS